MIERNTQLDNDDEWCLSDMGEGEFDVFSRSSTK